jgi:histidyl-tRNA synthetase
VEVIEIGYRFLAALDVPDVVVHLNSIGDPSDRIAYRDVIRAFLEDRASDLSADAQRRIATNPMRVLDSKADSAVVAEAPVPLDHLGPEAAAHFEEVKAGLKNLGIPYVIDDKLVRGLDYYNRTVFEYVGGSYDAAQSALGGGGRYDGLFELLGGQPTPAVGLAMGVGRILLASQTTDVGPRLDAFIVAVDDDRRQQARTLASTLRAHGHRVDMTDGPRSVKAQFKEADRSGASYVLVVGDEYDQGSVTVKTLADGEQQIIATKEISGWLTAR